MMDARDLQNLVRREIARMLDQRIKPPRHGTISAYDPATFMVKVSFAEDLDSAGQPKTTGWLPLSTQWAGNGWGLCAAPVLGAQVGVHFAEDDADNGFVSHHLYSGPDQALGTPAGELWIRHQNGLCLKIAADGHIYAGQANGTFKRLATEDFVLNIYNGHTHLYSPGDGTPTQTAGPNMTVASNDTTNLTAQLKAT